MSKGLYFHLTRAQAAALVRIRAGGRIAASVGSRGAPFLIDALRRRGLLDGWTLTPAGEAAATLAAILARVNPSSKAPPGNPGEGAR